jgi:hypothetical protein
MTLGELLTALESFRQRYGPNIAARAYAWNGDEAAVIAYVDPTGPEPILYLESPPAAITDHRCDTHH